MIEAHSRPSPAHIGVDILCKGGKILVQYLVAAWIDFYDWSFYMPRNITV